MREAFNKGKYERRMRKDRESTITSAQAFTFKEREYVIIALLDTDLYEYYQRSISAVATCHLLLL